MNLSPEQLESYRQGWRLRCEHRQEERERWKREARERARSIARTLVSDFGVETVHLVGSLARDAMPRHRPDIDLAVSGLPGDRYWKALSVASNAAVPFELDLIPIEDANQRMLQAVAEGEVLFDARRDGGTTSRQTCR